jgi:hypothetical protein
MFVKPTLLAQLKRSRIRMLHTVRLQPSISRRELPSDV